MNLKNDGVNLPWFSEVSQRLVQSYRVGRMPHGLLLAAPTHSGKYDYAQAIAKAIFCDNEQSKPIQQFELKACGHCKSCRLIENGSHPDLHLLKRLEEKGKLKRGISVDQVRMMIQKLASTAQFAGWRIVIVEAVEYLNNNGFNAMLKTLEEPGDKTLLLLCTSNLSAVPATIRSRCQIMTAQSEPQLMQQWLIESTGCTEVWAKKALQLAADGPTKARQLIEENGLEHVDAFYNHLDLLYIGRATPLAVLQEATQLERVYQLLASYWFQCLKCKLLNPKNTTEELAVDASTALVPNKKLSSLYDKTLQLIRIESTGGNLNHGLQLQTLLLEWFEIGKKHSKTLS